jgi:phosphate-selective porin OprO/OprP
MQINSDETQVSTFLIRRLRFGFEGTLYKKIDYDLEANIVSHSVELIFAWINFGYFPNAQIRVGQFKEPFSYEVLLPEKYLDFIERSMNATVLSPAEDIGIMVHNFGKPLAGFFEYGIGMFNGLGTDIKNTDKTFEYAGRINIYPFVLLENNIFNSLRLAGYVLYEGNRTEGVYTRQRTTLGFEFYPRIITNNNKVSFGADIQWLYKSFSLKAEYIKTLEDRAELSHTEIETDGWHIDLTYLLTGVTKTLRMKSGLEFAARIEQLLTDAGSPIMISDFTDISGNPVVLQKNDVTTITLGLNYYLNYNIKIQTNYQIDIFGNSLLTPSSRTGDILKSADDTRSKFLARVQLFF